MKNIIKAIILPIVLCLCLAACAASGQNSPGGRPKQNERLPEQKAGAQGGYIFTTDTTEVTLVTVTDGKYIKVKNEILGALECYRSHTEIIMKQTTPAGEVKYYEELLDNGEEQFDNPLQSVVGDINTGTFLYDEADGLYKFNADRAITVDKPVTAQIYLIQTTWTDGNQYMFEYFAFESGHSYVSAYAPDIINPVFTPDTKWCIDIEKQEIRNSETGRAVPFEIFLQRTEEDSIVPGGQYTHEQMINFDIRIEADRGEAQKIFCKIGEAPAFTLTCLRNVSIQKPERTEGAQAFGEDEWEESLARIFLAENILAAAY